MPRTNAERRAETRAKLIAAGRELFAAHGYGGVGTEAVVAAAGVTRGALYHHFADKQALFAGVVEAEMAAIRTEVDRAAEQAAGPAIEQLMAGGDAFLEAMADPARKRLLLIDGRAVLGPEGYGELDRKFLRESLELGLQAAIDAGAIRALPIAALTAVLDAMYDAAALSGDGDLADFRAVFRAVLGGLARS